MNKQKIISGVLGAVAGAIILATAFLGYTFYKALGVVSEDHAVLSQVVSFINQVQQQSQQAPKK